MIRSLERQLFYLDTTCEGEKDEAKRKEIEDEMEEHKQRLATLSDQLAIYIRLVFLIYFSPKPRKFQML